MRSLLLGVVLVAACTDVPTSTPAPEVPGGKADGITRACSQPYWDWLRLTYLPLLDRPLTEVSEADVLAEAAHQPDMEQNKYSYGLCWQGAFDKYFYVPALQHVHAAKVTFVDASSPAYKSLPGYLANTAMTPEIARNAKALLAVRPTIAGQDALGQWIHSYSDFMMEFVTPVGFPGEFFYLDVVEPEWVIDSSEAPYLDVMEAAGHVTATEPAFAEWTDALAHWIFGPPSAIGHSFVFSLPWEPGYDQSNNYGAKGILLGGDGLPYVPAPVRTFLDRIEATRPTESTAADTSDASAWWMIKFNARLIRAVGDLAQQQPVLTATDELALDVLDELRPTRVTGLAAYKFWLESYAVTRDANMAAQRARVMLHKPCVASADLAAAQAEVTTQAASLGDATNATPTRCAP